MKTTSEQLHAISRAKLGIQHSAALALLKKPMLAGKTRRRGSPTTFTIIAGGGKDQLRNPPAPSGAMLNIEFVASALDILELLASNSQGLVAQEVSARLGIQLDVAKELLSTLARHGFVKLDRRSKHYTVGAKLVELAGT